MFDAQHARPRRTRRAFLADGLGIGLGLATLGTSSRGDEPATQAARPLRVLLWCEGTASRTVYPDDVDGALAEHLVRHKDLEVRRARLNDPQSGLSDAALDATDVIVWWGRLRHDDLPDDRGAAVARRVREGRLGLVALHSSFSGKPFRELMGMDCEPGGWSEAGTPEHVVVQSPSHPIARGVGAFTIPRSDMFAEPYHFPEPETVVLVSSWDSGEKARSGLTWTIGKGRAVYLRAGLDCYPVLYHPSIRRLVANAVVWAGKRS
jgi:trehalose utilization protein